MLTPDDFQDHQDENADDEMWEDDGLPLNLDDGQEGDIEMEEPEFESASETETDEVNDDQFPPFSLDDGVFADNSPIDPDILDGSDGEAIPESVLEEQALGDNDLYEDLMTGTPEGALESPEATGIGQLLAPPELPVEPPAEEATPQARLFDYLIQLADDLPQDVARQAMAENIPERLNRIKEYLEAGKTPGELPVEGRTFVDRAAERAKRQGRPFEVFNRDHPVAAKSVAPIQPVGDHSSEIMVSTFSIISKLSKLMPAEQMAPLKKKIQHLITDMEAIRAHGTT